MDFSLFKLFGLEATYHDYDCYNGLLPALKSARAASTSLKEVRFNFLVVVTAEPYSLSVTVTCDGLPKATDEASDSSVNVAVTCDKSD